MAKVNTPASSGSTASFVVAGLWVRIKAFAFDYLFLAAYLILLTGAILVLRLTPLQTQLDALYTNPNIAQLTSSLLFDVPVIAYFALFEAGPWQATPGKRRMGLLVVTTGGGRLSVPQALARTVLKFVPWEIAHTSLWHTPGWPLHAQPIPLDYAGYILIYVLVGVYVVTLLTSATRQTLYDRLTRSRVVIVRRPH